MLDTLARASIDGAIVVAIVWILNRALPGLPAGARAFLWWCAAAKFVVGLVWTTPVLLPVLPAAERAATGSAVVATREIQPSTAASVASREPTERSRVLTWPVLLFAAWGFGCCESARRGLRRWRHLRRAAWRSSPAAGRVQVMATDLAAHLGVRRLPDVRVSHEVSTPLVTGVHRPMILLPMDRFDALSARQQRMTLCHELVHLKRSDLWLGCVPAVAERLFFFHPLAHVAVREYLFWREAACDAAVLEALDAAPQEYGRLLLDLGIARPRTSLAAAGAPWSFSILKRRIVMLRDPSSRSILSRVVAGAAVGLALAAIVPLQLSARPATVEAPSVLGIPAIEPAPSDDGQRSKNTVREEMNFVFFFDEDTTMMSGSVPGDINRARRFKRAGEPLLWFRKDGREYIVRDQGVLRDVERAWEPVNRVGDEQGKVGYRQGEIGTKQGEIGTRQGEVGTEQGKIGTEQGKIGTKQGELAARESARRLTDAQRDELDKERRALDSRMRDLDREMRKLDEKMREFDEPMSELNERMKVLDREMEALNLKMEIAKELAQKEMLAVLERAIANGRAEAVK